MFTAKFPNSGDKQIRKIVRSCLALFSGSDLTKYTIAKYITTIEISEASQMLVPPNVVIRKNQKNIAVHQSVDSPF
jgi:hypothetical protein